MLAQIEYHEPVYQEHLLKKGNVIPWGWIVRYIETKAWNNHDENDLFVTKWKTLPTNVVILSAERSVKYIKKCSDLDILSEIRSFELGNKKRVTVLRAIDERLGRLSS